MASCGNILIFMYTIQILSPCNMQLLKKHGFWRIEPVHNAEVESQISNLKLMKTQLLFCYNSRPSPSPSSVITFHISSFLIEKEIRVMFYTMNRCNAKIAVLNDKSFSTLTSNRCYFDPELKLKIEISDKSDSICHTPYSMTTIKAFF